MAASKNLTPAERVIRARVAAYAMHSQGKTNTAAGTRAFLEKSERQADPDGVLSPEERRKRAIQARKSYMGALSLKAAKARRQ